jgi:(3S)-malyl-CoA thioesterase
MHLCFQLAILSARARDVWVLDGVFNALDDPEGLEAECVEGRNLGFDGKTLIHPNQIDIAARIYSPNARDIEEAEALIAAFTGGAERYRDRMIEEMHVDAARALLVRAAR